MCWDDAPAANSAESARSDRRVAWRNSIRAHLSESAPQPESSQAPSRRLVPKARTNNGIITRLDSKPGFWQLPKSSGRPKSARTRPRRGEHHHCRALSMSLAEDSDQEKDDCKVVWQEKTPTPVSLPARTPAEKAESDRKLSAAVSPSPSEKAKRRRESEVEEGLLDFRAPPMSPKKKAMVTADLEDDGRPSDDPKKIEEHKIRMAIVEANRFDMKPAIVRAARRDPDYQELVKALEEKPLKSPLKGHILDKEKLLRYNAGYGWVLVVPNDASLRHQILHAVHDDLLGHFGRARTLVVLRQAFWWPTMAEDVAIYTKTCRGCQLANPASRRLAGDVQLMRPPAAPGHTIQIDFYGPLEKSKNGNTFIFGAQDMFTRMIVLEPVPFRISQLTKISLDKQLEPREVHPDQQGVVAKQYLRNRRKVADRKLADATPKGKTPVRRGREPLRRTVFVCRKA